MTDSFFKQIHFPYGEVRKGQDKFLEDVYECIKKKKNMLVSAPTGIGKTVSGLAPAIFQAKARGLSVVCLTSRQTQANQVIKTILDIQKTSKEEINYVAFIGKRSMCIHDDRDLYPAQDFNEFCKKTKEKGKCGHYLNAKNAELEEVKKSIVDTSVKAGMSVEGFVNLCKSNRPDPEVFPKESKCGFCPYELAGDKAYQADVIICDFNYMFQQGIREGFLGKIGRPLEECILLVDEAHNLPDRIRNAYSFNLSSQMLKNAIAELKDFKGTKHIEDYIRILQQLIEDSIVNKSLQEILVDKKFLENQYLPKIDAKSFEEIIDEMQEFTLLVKEERVISHVERIANFLSKWIDSDSQNYLRLLEKETKNSITQATLKLKCIDPAEVSSQVVNKTFSTIFMSATLSPIQMYRDMLGVENAHLLELDSPFDQQNQLTLVVDDVTTKYSSRSPTMFEKIGTKLKTALHSAYGKNAIVFFPSYNLMEQVLSTINILDLERKIYKEQKHMTKEQKEDIVEDFRSPTGFSTKSKVLFAVTSGSFAEGLDLPSEALEMVIVVGLPLGVPDLTTNALINHFDKKFKKGQLYGYVYPAMSKIIQAGGRCIRTTQDRGAVILMDNRFYFPMYAQTFPKNWKLQKSKDLAIDLGNFF